MCEILQPLSDGPDTQTITKFFLGLTWLILGLYLKNLNFFLAWHDIGRYGYLKKLHYVLNILHIVAKRIWKSQTRSNRKNLQRCLSTEATWHKLSEEERGSTKTMKPSSTCKALK